MSEIEYYSDHKEIDFNAYNREALKKTADTLVDILGAVETGDASVTLDEGKRSSQKISAEIIVGAQQANTADRDRDIVVMIESEQSGDRSYILSEHGDTMAALTSDGWQPVDLATAAASPLVSDAKLAALGLSYLQQQL